MRPEALAQWRAADEVFNRWLDLPAGDRDAWLQRQALESEVRRRAEQLVAAHQRPRASIDPAGSDLAGCQLGAWTLESELGRGGMAVVYHGWREQGMARQQAAIKILTLGALGATGSDRFHREAAILARLAHPNITTLIDSGVAADGTCWLAMPLVTGNRIDDWCESRALDARAIVRLYLQVCDAVASAHRNLVIHRDIKPSNVLVDSDGQVRLLDFGIGQFTDVESERTSTLWRAVTPGYAAPEQLRGDPPTTAIDVYGLGALLHRLLTGRTPQSDSGTETTRPSLLVRPSGSPYHRHYVPLRNDLDRVLLKALAEEPGQRYATAEAMAEDLRRWLDGQPVLAEKPGVLYRARKFVVRNAVGVAAGVLLLASVAGGVGATLWQAREAQREAENARAQAQRAELVRDFLERVFTSTDPAAGGVPDALELLDEGARRARSDILRTDPLAAADILMLTGGARLALGQYDEGREDLEEAKSLLGNPEAGAFREHSQIESHLSQLSRMRGDGATALRHARAALAFAERAQTDAEDAQTLLAARVYLGMALFAGTPEAAAAEFEQVLAALPAAGLKETELHLTALDGLSASLSVLEPVDIERIVELAEEQIRLSQLIDGPESGQYANTLADQVPTFSRAGNPERAEALALEAVAIADRAYTRPHHNRAAAHCQLGSYLTWQGRYGEALRYFAIADEINSALAISNLHAEACFRFSGYVHAAQGEHAKALTNLMHSWKILGEHDQHNSASGESSCGVRASVHLRLGDIAAAEKALAECVPDAGTTPQMMLTQAQAELHLVRGRFTDAARLAAGMREERPPAADDRYWMRPWMLSLLLAHRTGDTQSREMLVAGLGDFAATPTLSQCLERPTEVNCLALP
ncbi:serine/threonine-protein kinase [Lysobacter sp. H23M47]|uniref:serine/threonine protein kinase n=1 Tax=Lysobacter sp. H23M47 TaxID=2781024 RepID=UPI001882DEFD|nr:serine/threonine-protein kinase [Lysobacter sp. H23M47]QOW24910.1 serine/threonine protein kinase [Lysobacter sp. H23M47]